ncbi:MAG: right-handed parallel beta-helix repeat-containing protein [Candidatus Hydrogenedentes bacterium]|nr:right-handed parallel beta-helix repeat-containing protein [Candidatus Hydrogenedentota bacterium]
MTRCLFVVFASSCIASIAMAEDGGPGAAGLAVLVDSGNDATEALQAAADRAKGVLELPSGTLLIGRPIVIDLTKTGFRGVRGESGASRVIMNGSGPAFRVVGDHQGTADPNSVQEHTWEMERFPVLSGFEILGAHPEADGVELVRTMKCTIQNVLIRKCRFGVHLVERNRNFILADSHIYNGTDSGVFFDQCNLHQANIIGNHISYNARAGIRQFNGDVHNIQITGNDIEYNSGSTESSGEIVLEAPDGIISEYTIAGNTIQARPENAGANILIVGSEANTPHAARVLSITGNVVGSRTENVRMEHASRATVTGNTIYGGVSLNVHLRYCQGVVIGDNSVGTRPTMHDSESVYDDGVLYEVCKDCTLSGGILSGMRYGKEAEGGAVTLRDCVNCRVSDLQIVEPKVRGVHVIAGTGNTISATTIVQRDNPELRAGISVGGSNQILQGNVFIGTLEKPIEMPEGTGISMNNTSLRP